MDPDAVDDLCSGAHEGTGVGESGRVPHGSTDDPELLDFSANTNPRTPKGVARIYEAALAEARTYPSTDYCEFRTTAAEYVGCEGPQVIPTSGGLGAIRLTLSTCVRPGDTVLVPAPSFGEYAREVRLQGAEPVFVDHDAVDEHDPADHAMAIVCNPNNPTGDAYDRERLRAFAERCRESGTVLLLDEAFMDFADRPSMAGTDGVVVARSLTKIFGLPGLRAGFAVATGDLRDRLDVARTPWSMGGPAATVGTYCLRREPFVVETRERVHRERARMRERLSQRFAVRGSDAPFLLLELESPGDVDDLLSSLRGHGIAVRDARTFRGLDRHVRVAVRTRADDDRLLDALDV
ncbi:threonine-phosphate decarboxylase CobD [Halomicrobium salinisoli]|uniref:threonine-phosphate decarboxylase CobD n=1 Tax=Halomicrobium salinisoli TaxID=2878391 RepID=UPI001CF05559|nr:threonine-phosphate decarboxylase CobD [Halomicrobium salinisoli]